MVTSSRWRGGILALSFLRFLMYVQSVLLLYKFGGISLFLFGWCALKIYSVH